MEQVLRALIVEDNPSDAELLIMELQDNGFEVLAQRVDTASAYLKALESETWDIIFSDHSMPHFSSFQALKLRNEKELDIPFIILSGTIGEDLAVEAMKAGANDYFLKGKLTRLIAAVNRELKEARDREIRRKTEQELDYFISSLTHDFCTPILAVHRALGLMKTGVFGPLSSEQREIIEEVVWSVHFIQHMVDNILFTYKYKQQKIHLATKQTNVVSLIQWTIDNTTTQAFLKQKPHQIMLETTIPESVTPEVAIDRDEIQRVLQNLIKNAIDYTPTDSTITISTEWQGQSVRVGIRDHGEGVHPKVESHLFKLYATPSAKKLRHVGMGLGLYLSKQIVEAHHGKIGYERKEDGSLFYMDLPV